MIRIARKMCNRRYQKMVTSWERMLKGTLKKKQKTNKQAKYR